MPTTEKAKHTSGPWRMGNHGQFGTFNPPQIFAESGEAVAQVYGIPLHTTLEEVNEERYAEGLANASLIAASPEMLSALESIQTLSAYMISPGGGAGTLMKIGALAENAIRRAKGA